MKITDENVVKELRSRNEKALHFIIDIYGGLITSIVRKHLFSLEDMQEECIDDILLAVWNHIKKFDEEKNSLKNWIAAVSKYKAIDTCRKYMKQAERDSLNEGVYVTMTDHDVVSLEMERMLDHLKKEDKEIFMKRYVEEESVEEIAESMGMKSGVIYNRLSRGRQKLRSLFLHSRAK
ncbi:RNA polymerase sigma70 factor [Bacillus manliponensis]|uniref:RNA polymerase sigma70 factor n=1 Tax=Bacillus manliponensis TaxID=574376 RepID=A0A073JXI8_9BACI|nr:sigma-70 family RNA polymerase sigma factor [Bacillus manliponensis]KEK18971.1 RNA polymerase sigma70 factor [Bacillus manliponensis]